MTKRAHKAAVGEAPLETHGSIALAVSALLEPEAAHLGLRLLAGAAGLGRRIDRSRVQRPGLALSGYTDYIRYGRVQIVGSSEIGYLRKLSVRKRSEALAQLARCEVSCFVVTKGLLAPKELLASAEAQAVPVLLTATDSSSFVKQLSAFLELRLATRLHLHAVLMDVFGLGVLIQGESGIGKSECALDLVDRGHRLVADDVVEIRRMADSLLGVSPELTRHHMELRGLGVINIKDLYGVSSIRLEKRLELVIDLERWEAGKEYDRLGLGDETFLILGVAVPLIRMPVAPGRNLAILVEVAARNRLAKQRGYDAARQFAERVDDIVAGRSLTSGPSTVVARGRRSPARSKSGGR
jgi:HPr kinase/phosphorylase